MATTYFVQVVFNFLLKFSMLAQYLALKRGQLSLMYLRETLLLLSERFECRPVHNLRAELFDELLSVAQVMLTVVIDPIQTSLYFGKLVFEANLEHLTRVKLRLDELAEAIHLLLVSVVGSSIAYLDI